MRATGFAVIVAIVALIGAACGSGSASSQPSPTRAAPTQVRPTAPAGSPTPTPIPVSPTPRPTPTPIEIPTPLPPGAPVPVTITSVTDGYAGHLASVSARTAPRTQCGIVYTHPSGKISTVRGLGAVVSDQYGYVSWTFHIDSTTKPGTGKIQVTCGGTLVEHPIIIH